MKVEVIQVSKGGTFKVKEDDWFVFPNNYEGYEEFGTDFPTEQKAVEFAKKLANKELVKIYPKTVLVLET